MSCAQNLWRNLKGARTKWHNRVVVDKAVAELKIATFDQLRLPGVPNIQSLRGDIAGRCRI